MGRPWAEGCFSLVPAVPIRKAGLWRRAQTRLQQGCPAARLLAPFTLRGFPIRVNYRPHLFPSPSLRARVASFEAGQV